MAYKGRTYNGANILYDEPAMILVMRLPEHWRVCIARILWTDNVDRTGRALGVNDGALPRLKEACRFGESVKIISRRAMIAGLMRCNYPIWLAKNRVMGYHEFSADAAKHGYRATRKWDAPVGRASRPTPVIDEYRVHLGS